jgi:hypothetical protein
VRPDGNVIVESPAPAVLPEHVNEDGGTTTLVEGAAGAPGGSGAAGAEAGDGRTSSLEPHAASRIAVMVPTFLTDDVSTIGRTTQPSPEARSTRRGKAM